MEKIFWILATITISVLLIKEVYHLIEAIILRIILAKCKKELGENIKELIEKIKEENIEIEIEEDEEKGEE